MERSYMITLYAPLGEKHGAMVMQVDNLTAHGFLHILGKKQPYTGELDTTGNCTLHGKLVTPVRTIPYTAIGTVDEHRVELVLQSEHDVLHLCGVAKTCTGGECL